MISLDCLIFLSLSLVSNNSGFASAWSSTSSWVRPVPTARKIPCPPLTSRFAQENPEGAPNDEEVPPLKKTTQSRYSLGLGKNLPVRRTSLQETQEEILQDEKNATLNWIAPEPVAKPEPVPIPKYDLGVGKNKPSVQGKPFRTKRVITKNDAESAVLKGALWHEEHYASSKGSSVSTNSHDDIINIGSFTSIPKPSVMYPDIDLSIPESVYSEEGHVDLVWDMLRYEAQIEAQREPLLVSFLHSTILNHNSLESALAFHLANKLASPAMISTQIQSLVLEALQEFEFRRCLRADMMAVRDRDPACTCLPDVFLYFKGFHALQTHRVGHYMHSSGRKVLAFFLQSQMSQNFQIDIHPNATMGRGIMLDHGTGIVVGETARVGHNCSILHHVTLGGSGKQGVDRHPKVGDGVLLGAGASVLGNVQIGDGCQVGAGTLVISDLPPHSVAVGVPAKIIGSFVDVTVQPSLDMNQMMGSRDFDQNIVFESEGI